MSSSDGEENENDFLDDDFGTKEPVEVKPASKRALKKAKRLTAKVCSKIKMCMLFTYLAIPLSSPLQILFCTRLVDTYQHFRFLANPRYAGCPLEQVERPRASRLPTCVPATSPI